jgi:hypothetical protein
MLHFIPSRCWPPAFALILASAGMLAARDSTWLLCSDDSLALSAHEHRAPGGDGRETSLTLIFGVHEMRGVLRDADTGKVTLKRQATPDTKFAGQLSLDFEANTVALNGTLTIDGQPTKVKTTLECKQMSPELY